MTLSARPEAIPIDAILEERGTRYGQFKEHARITQQIKSALVSGQSWFLLTPSQKEALEMLAHKMGRIVNGDPTYLDSWVDITGYNQLVVKEMQNEEALKQAHEEDMQASAKLTAAVNETRRTTAVLTAKRAKLRK